MSDEQFKHCESCKHLMFMHIADKICDRCKVNSLREDLKEEGEQAEVYKHQIRNLVKRLVNNAGPDFEDWEEVKDDTPIKEAMEVLGEDVYQIMKDE